ncbi:hypothetical protein MNBD_ALPHA02-486 [hydrothermal vent metagenome]|uniref:DUF3576 domain-containing protein n=1 Tax=hydrothermal vent metagenome TaxID=652676 RepID=A0A3B0RMQ6_9ZZZZ
MSVYQRIRNIARVSAKAMAVGLVLTLGGCGIFGGDSPTKKVEAAEEVYQIGVNAYLWRSALDTMSFMPILSADQNGGIILTDWTNNPGNVNERTKVDILIVGRKLTADSLNVSVHRQFKVKDSWQDTSPRPGAAVKITNAILMQARLLRRDNAPIK